MQLKIVIGVLGVLIIVLAGWYFVMPLFNTVEVQDELPPEFSQEEIDSTEMTNGTGGGDSAVATTTNNGESTETQNQTNEGGSVNEGGNTETPSAEQSQTLFPIVETAFHPAEGSVRVLRSGGQTIIRYEDFKTINGPNLHVYLAKDLDAAEFVDLGPIRGTEGNINYTIPADIDVSEYRYVMYWCVPFSVLFNYAEINPA